MDYPIVDVAGEQLTLLPEKLIYWPPTRTLLVADTHFGKASTFRQAGIPVPDGTTTAMLKRLTVAIQRCAPDRLVILGDFVHSATRGPDGFEAQLIQWRDRHPSLKILLVRGNHDRGHAKLFKALDLEMVQEPFAEPPFAFCHFPTVRCENSLHKLAGHVHPAIQLRDGSRSSIKIPCFWLSQSFSVLPAFGEFTGCGVIQPGSEDLVFVVSDGAVIDATRIVLT